jgi:hypothetical protein
MNHTNKDKYYLFLKLKKKNYAFKCRI